ncbi:MAG: tetratricopeptide repeat protein, partial [Flavobacterium sp.]|nr:tetratricopeptide repeat protein [Flavobacterium sp.]
MSYKLLLIVFFLFSACNKDGNGDYNVQIEAGASEAFLRFEQAKEVEDTREKMALLSAALAAVDDVRDTLVPQLLDFKIYYHNSLKEYDSAYFYSDSLIRMAGMQQDTATIALGLYRRSRAQFFLDKHEEVFRDAFEARRLFLAVKDSSSAGRRSLEMANAQARMGDFTGSRESATEALRYLDYKIDSVYLGSAYNLIAISYRQQGFNEDAITEYRNALSFSTKRADSLIYLNNIAVALQDLENYKEAIAILEDLAQGSEIENVPSRARFLDNLAHTKWLQNRTANVERDLIEALNLRLDAGDKHGQITSYEHLVKYYSGKNDALARDYTEKQLKIAKDYGNSNGRQSALKHLLALAPATERAAYAEEYVRLSDSLGDAALKAQNTFAKIRFDEERKEEEIANLETQNTLQELQTRQMRTHLFISLLVAMLLILGLSFLIYFLRQRQKKHEIREVHKTESRISKVIHDELANDIFNIMSSLEPVAPIPVIDKLEKIYLRTRDISRENREIDTGEDYVDYLKAILSNNTSDDSKLVVSGENSVNWDKLQVEMKIVIYRVLQELMINMKKHSDAKLVAISFVVK